MLIPILIVALAWSVTRPQPSSEFREGYYETNNGKITYKLRNGRFRALLQPEPVRGKQDFLLIGRYDVSGTRIVITYEYEMRGSNLVDVRTIPLFAGNPPRRMPDYEVRYFRTIGGVHVLLGEGAMEDLNAGKKLPDRYNELFVFTTKPRYRGTVGWLGFLRRHPEFAAAVNTSFVPVDISWWAYKRWQMHEDLEWSYPELYRSLPEWVKQL